MYKCIMKLIWTYGIQLWGCTKPSNTKLIQRFQSKVLRLITNAPWYVSNLFFLIWIVGGGIKVHSKLRSLNGLLCQPRVIMIMEKSVE
jgi:hypothetical protein